jgi:hypothetical protein
VAELGVGDWTAKDDNNTEATAARPPIGFAPLTALGESLGFFPIWQVADT